ncbi:MAG: hypothetical protein IT281_05405, partial [Ignavibacteria bacterium]|nr:hypothetical protein [Ignavibacteria bacterium]
MIGIFAVAEGAKRAFITKAIQFFTAYQLKALKEKYPDCPEIQNITRKTIPSHTFITGDTLLMFDRLIFESEKTQQLNYYYEPYLLFDYPVPYDPLIFRKISKNRLGNWYGALQLVYHIRRWFWENIMPYPTYRFWAWAFHGNKDIKQWGNWFPWSDVCTEIIYVEASEYKKKYSACSQIVLNKVNQNNLSPLDAIDLCM